MAEFPPMKVEIACPVCEEPLPVPIAVTMEWVADNQQQMVSTPDLTDVWAHAWTHRTDRRVASA